MAGEHLLKSALGELRELQYSLLNPLVSTPSVSVVDLGAYLSQIASAVMAAHEMEGFLLDMKFGTWPVSINVAIPVGLVVNELMTIALKQRSLVVTLARLYSDASCIRRAA